MLIEKTVALDVQKAYEELRSILLENNCRIIMEEPLKSIIVEHGYPSSMSPKDTWKKVSFYLFPDSTRTRIVGSLSIIFPIPISIITRLIIALLILFTIGVFISEIGAAALVGLIATIIIYENYYRLHRKRNLFLEEVFRRLELKTGKN